MLNDTQQGISNHLPHLRRYARAIAGNQEDGDKLVFATLAILKPDRSVSREILYRAFVRVWAGQWGEKLRDKTSSQTLPKGGDKYLSSIPSTARQVFLLEKVEKFTPRQIAEILEIGENEVSAARAEAIKSITTQIRTDVLIIEDEMFIATELEDIMLSLGHNVVGIERTRRNALRAIEKTKPGLILVDVQLADGSSGIDAANEILERCQIPAVFITAYPERLLAGKRPEPAFVMTKPFKAEQVSAVISQALFFNAVARPAPGLMP